jgi:hypothetical protein
MYNAPGGEGTRALGSSRVGLGLGLGLGLGSALRTTHRRLQARGGAEDLHGGARAARRRRLLLRGEQLSVANELEAARRNVEQRPHPRSRALAGADSHIQLRAWGDSARIAGLGGAKQRAAGSNTPRTLACRTARVGFRRSCCGGRTLRLGEDAQRDVTCNPSLQLGFFHGPLRWVVGGADRKVSGCSS